MDTQYLSPMVQHVGDKFYVGNIASCTEDVQYYIFMMLNKGEYEAGNIFYATETKLKAFRASVI